MLERFTLEKSLRKRYWKFSDFIKGIEKITQKKAEQNHPQSDDKIITYIRIIQKFLDTEKGRNMFKSKAIYKYIANPTNIPQYYFKNIILNRFAKKLGYTSDQLKNENIKQIVIQQFEKETGKKFTTFELTPEEKVKLLKPIIEHQKKTLYKWFDYLSSSESHIYPSEFRYWIFAEVLKCGRYDKKRKKYYPRTKLTISPFPDINKQVLYLLFNELTEKYQRQPSLLLIDLPDEQKKEWHRLLINENFSTMYPWLFEFIKTLKTPKEMLIITEGEWEIFPQGSNPKSLFRKIKRFNIEWEINSESMAKLYLLKHNVFIYFSKNNKGKPFIPRILIITDKKTNKIVLMNGIEERFIDPYMIPVVEKALNEGIEKNDKKIKFSGFDQSIQSLPDRLKIKKLFLKYQQHLDFTPEELKFLYQIERRIIVERKEKEILEFLLDIRSKRKKKDLAIIFNCAEDEIALNDNEITDKTVVLYNDLHSSTTKKWEKMPANLQFIVGNADFSDSQLENLGNLKKVYRHILLNNSRIKTLGNLEEILGDADFRNSSLKDMGKLKMVGGTVYISNNQKDLIDILINKKIFYYTIVA